MQRISRDEYYLRIAEATAKRSACLDKQVGCVLVNEIGLIIATGYNGPPRGMEHCKYCKVNLYGKKEECPAAHAEQNALLYANCNDIHTCYLTLEPCIVCTRMLMNTSCRRVVFFNRTSKSGFYLWEQMNDSTTWEYRSIERTCNR